MNKNQFPPNRHTASQLGPIKLRSRNLAICLVAFSLFVLAPVAHGQQTVHLVSHGSTPESGCVEISVDTAAVHILAQVGPDALPGDYIYATSPEGPNHPQGSVGVRVFSDHSFAYIGSNDTFYNSWNSSAGPGPR